MKKGVPRKAGKERLGVLLLASLHHGGCGATGRSHLVRTRLTLYPQCVFLRLQQLMEATESPLKGMVALPTAKPISKHLRAISSCSGGCSFCSWPGVACHPRGSGVPLRTAHELCSRNPFSGACPVLHAAGKCGTSRVLRLSRALQNYSLCASDRARSCGGQEAAAAGWGRHPQRDTSSCHQHPQGHGSTSVCVCVPCPPLPAPYVHLVTVAEPSGHCRLRWRSRCAARSPGDAVTGCSEDTGSAAEGASRIPQTELVLPTSHPSDLHSEVNSCEGVWWSQKSRLYILIFVRRLRASLETPFLDRAAVPGG